MSETRQAADQLQRRRTSSAAVSFRSTAARTHYRLFPCASKTTVKRAIKHIWIFIKSACALISAIICWLGLWEIFDLYLFKKTVLRDCLYVIVCAIIMGMTSTYLPNCGIYEDDKAQIDAQEAAIASADEWETTLGASPDDAFSPTMSPSPPVASGEDASSAPVGSSHGGVVAHDSDRLIEMTPSPSGVGLPVSNSDLSIDLRNQPEDVDAMLVAESRTESYSRACWFLSTQLCTLDVFVRVYCCSIVALFASIGFWAGAYNLLLEFFLLVSASKDWLAYTLNLVIGWALMWATGTLFEQAGLTEEETEPLESKPPTSPHVVAGEEPAVAPAPPKKSCLPPRLHVYVRASLAITGCMMFWLGASMLLEIWSNVYYVSPTDDSARPPDESTNGVLHCNDCTDSTPARNGIFILLGLFMFVITDTMAIHAGVEESIQSIAPEMTAAQQQHDAAASSSSLPVDQHRLVSVVGSDSHLASAPPRSTFARFLANPLVRHIRALTSLMGVMMLWEGVWDAAFNAEAESHGWERMVVYTSVGLIGLMLTNSLFANSGVVPPFAMAKRSTQIQQRLGFHLQEKHFLSAAHGGQAHDPDMLSALEPQRSADDAAPADAPSFNTLRHPSPQAPTTVGSNAAMSSSPVPTPPLDGAQLDMSSKLPFRSMDA